MTSTGICEGNSAQEAIRHFVMNSPSSKASSGKIHLLFVSLLYRRHCTSTFVSLAMTLFFLVNSFESNDRIPEDGHDTAKFDGLSDAAVDELGIASSDERSHCRTVEGTVSAVMTQYDISPGGGEKYLLEAVALFQGLGHFVHIVTSPGNVCHELECLRTVANALRAPISFDQLCVVTFENLNDERLRNFYHYHFLLGNEKIPQVRGFGHFNIYMCQFPFDLERTYAPESASLLMSYDLVWLNSEYSWKWYHHFVWPQLEESVQSFYAYSATREGIAGDPWPDIQVLYPPVTLHTCESIEDSFRTRGCQSIVLLGRFFEGRQSKGHSLAIELIRSIIQSYPDLCITLDLVGNIQPGHSKYVEKLRAQAVDLPVTFYPSVDSAAMKALMCSASVQWHLTGAVTDELSDPASIEHFGMSVVEGMSAGIIPVVLNRGGTAEIVDDNFGRSVDGLADYLRATVDILKYPTDIRQEMRERAFAESRKFSRDVFVRDARKKIVRGEANQLFLKHLLHHIPFFTAATEDSSGCRDPGGCVAVLTDFGGQPSSGGIIKNVMSKLGQSWNLVVIVAPETVRFALEAVSSSMDIRDLETVAFSRNASSVLPRLVAYSTERKVRVMVVDKNSRMHTDTSVYSQMLMSVKFWDILDAETVLVFQTDSFFGSSGPDVHTFSKYDYVGAPWCENNDIIGPILASGELKHLVGNGGLSLRTKSSMQHCIRNYNGMYGMREPEDRFFLKCLSREASKQFHVAPVAVARRFAVEVFCKEWRDKLEKDPPLAYHASWYYAPVDRVAKLALA